VGGGAPAAVTDPTRRARGAPGPAAAAATRLPVMDVVFRILLVLHLLGWATVLGGVLVSMRPPRIPSGILHGVLTALVTGVLMAGLGFSGVAGHDYDHVKIAVKTVVALVVTVLVWLGQRRPERVTAGYLGAIAGLTVVNVAIAVLWR